MLWVDLDADHHGHASCTACVLFSLTAVDYKDTYLQSFTCPEGIFQ